MGRGLADSSLKYHHHAKSGGSQMLVGVGGRGCYQEYGKAPVEILPGTVIHIPAGVKHWHGVTRI